MLAALEALIEHGKGGPAAVALKQTAALMLRVGIDETGAGEPGFDELMATLAAALDDRSILVLGPEVRAMPGLLTSFTATVLSRYHEIANRESGLAPATASEAAAPTEADSAPAASEVPAPPGPAQPPDAGRPAAIPLPPAPVTPVGERRAAPRDPGDLLTLARSATAEHLEQIARLPALPDRLTSIIAMRGHMPAILAVLANPGAAFGRTTLAMLAELAASDRSLRLAMAARPDLPGDAVDRLWPLMGREARAAAAMSGASVSVEAARLALAAAERAGLGAPEGTGLRRPLDELRRLAVASLQQRQAALRELADQGRAAELAAFASAELGIAFGVAFAMLEARLDHAAAILVRAMSGGGRVLEAVLDMRRAAGRTAGGGDVRAALDGLDPDEARLLARMIDDRAAPAEEAPLPAAGRPVLALVG
jgi:hypothetical protein